MYVIIKDGDSAVRRQAADAWDHAQSLPLRDAAKLRRDILKRKRLQEAAGREDLVVSSIEQMRAIRRSMEKRING